MSERDFELVARSLNAEKAHQEPSWINRLADEWNESSVGTKLAVGAAAAVGAIVLGRVAWMRAGMGRAAEELGAGATADAALLKTSFPLSEHASDCAAMLMRRPVTPTPMFARVHDRANLGELEVHSGEIYHPNANLHPVPKSLQELLAQLR